METEDQPAITGHKHFSANGFANFTLYDWPINHSDYDRPAQNLMIRCRDDGAVSVWIIEDWSDCHDDA